MLLPSSPPTIDSPRHVLADRRASSPAQGRWQQALQAWRRWRERREARAVLCAMDAHMLADIGVDPDIVRRECAGFAQSASRSPGRAGFVAAIVLIAVLGAAALLATCSRPTPTPELHAEPQHFDPSRFILNALLVPALDGDAMPLRWVDPRAPALCGPDTNVRVDDEPLAAGALVLLAPTEN